MSGQECVEIPEDLQLAYYKSLARLPHLVAAVSDHEWDADFLASVLAALAAVKGHAVTAEAMLEFSSADVAEEFIEWFFNR